MLLKKLYFLLQILHFQWYMKHTHLADILVQVTIYRRLLIGRDVHLDQSEATAYDSRTSYDIS